MINSLVFHHCIIGASGSGKTYLAQKIFRYLPANTIFVDSAGVYNGEYAILNFNQIKQLIFEEKFKRHLKEGTSEFIKCVYRFPIDIRSNNDKTYLTDLIAFVFQHQLLMISKGVFQPYVIMIDEIHFFQSNHNIPAELDRMFCFGRNYNFFGYAISQRAQHIHKNITTQSNIVLGKVYEEDIYYFLDKGIPTDLLMQEKWKFNYYNRLDDSKTKNIELLL